VKRRDDVRLGPLALEHAPRMLEWMKDRDVAVNLGLSREPSLAYTEEWIARALGDESVRAFAILVDGAHVGNVVLDQIDRRVGTARLSIYVGERAARGGGVGRTAVALAADEAFGPLALHKLWLTVHARNTAAINAYLDVGFSVEGVLRDEFLLDGERVAALRMGLLVGEHAP
jgi:RimJ/RimL family protein N-acetyltransferase